MVSVDRPSHNTIPLRSAQIFYLLQSKLRFLSSQGYQAKLVLYAVRTDHNILYFDTKMSLWMKITKKYAN
jgi:hypothetical protein